MKIRIDGFDELERALKEDLPKATARGVLRRGGIKAMKPVADRMAELAPYDADDQNRDGEHLRDTMKVQSAKAKFMRAAGLDPKKGVMILAGPAPKTGTTAAAAGTQEFGTPQHPAQAYSRPAADEKLPGVLTDVKKFLAEEIEKARQRIARKAARAAAKR